MLKVPCSFILLTVLETDLDTAGEVNDGGSPESTLFFVRLYVNPDLGIFMLILVRYIRIASKLFGTINHRINIVVNDSIGCIF